MFHPTRLPLSCSPADSGQGIDGARVDALSEKAAIYCNKNSVPGDTKPFVPGGIRLGTPFMTSRGLKEKDFIQVARFLDRSVLIAAAVEKGLAGTLPSPPPSPTSLLFSPPFPL